MARKQKQKSVLEENRKSVVASPDAVKTKGEHSTTVVPHGTKEWAGGQEKFLLCSHEPATAP